MALLSKAEIRSALERVGALAAAAGEHVDMLILGGTVMVLAFEERAATADVDAMVLSPVDRSRLRDFIDIVARERGWPGDWLNEGAKGFVMAPMDNSVLISATGITIRIPTVEQLLAMKLCAWRDDVDISDARRLLGELSGIRNEVWLQVSKYLQPGRELKAQYAFDDLWERLYGST